MRDSKNSKKVKIEPKATAANRDELPNGRWFKPVMFGFFLLGFIWIVMYYISGAVYPLGSGSPINIGSWNIAAGFSLVMVGFAMATRWK